MNRKIISIDDSDIAQDLIVAKLEELGYSDIIRFNDPLEALRAIQEGEVEADVLLIDIMMPQIDGIELCARIRQIEGWLDVPIIMLTSMSEVSYLLQAFMAGANDYVTKPFHEVELYARIRNCLRLKAELDRRIYADATRIAQSGSSTTDVAEIMSLGAAMGSNGLSCNKNAFEASLKDISSGNLDKLGIAAFRIDPLKGLETLDEMEKIATVNRIAATLSSIPVPAGDMLTQWDADTFCFSSVASDADSFTRRTLAIIDAVDKAGITAPGMPSHITITVSAGVCPPGTIRSAASGLGNALIACRDASMEEPCSIRFGNSTTDNELISE